MKKGIDEVDDLWIRIDWRPGIDSIYHSVVVLVKLGKKMEPIWRMTNEWIDKQILNTLNTRTKGG